MKLLSLQLAFSRYLSRRLLKARHAKTETCPTIEGTAEGMKGDTILMTIEIGSAGAAMGTIFQGVVPHFT